MTPVPLSSGGIVRLGRSVLLPTSAMFVATLLAGCQGALSTATGPSRNAVVRAAGVGSIPGMQVVPVTAAVAQAMTAREPTASLAATLGDAQPVGTVVGVGDSVEVTIWEAPPAVLFAAGVVDSRIGSSPQASRPGNLPELVVSQSGTITIPFAGQVPAAGRTLRQIEQAIVARLRGKANQPQAIVRLSRNATANVSIVGDVENPGRVPLTPKGERLLDAIAAAGGTRQPIDRMTVQVSRGETSVTVPLQAVVRDPRQNIVLQRDDVVTAFYQPNSFTVLGAAGKNEEVRFEGTGLSLSQALGRIGGLQDMRADPRGVFLFRWETPEQVRAVNNAAVVPLAIERVPVVYQVDLKAPQTYFAAQAFPMRNGDVLFISNSPSADFQRFVNLLASSVLPAVSVTNSVGL